MSVTLTDEEVIRVLKIVRKGYRAHIAEAFEKCWGQEGWERCVPEAIDRALAALTREQEDDSFTVPIEHVAEAPVTDVGSTISMPVGASRGTHVLTVSGVEIHAGDTIRVYRRRAPAREGGAK